MKDICKSFARKLEDRRQQLGLTQIQLADAIGYSEKTVSKWESGDTMLKTKTVSSQQKIFVNDIINFFHLIISARWRRKSVGAISLLWQP